MNPIEIKNEYGQTIEVRWDDDGNIQVRHSDIDRVRFGDLKQHDTTSRLPGFKQEAKARGVDVDDPVAKEMLKRMGSYLVIEGETYIINAHETALIFDVVKRNGGILPNWATRL